MDADTCQLTMCAACDQHCKVQAVSKSFSTITERLGSPEEIKVATVEGQGPLHSWFDIFRSSQGASRQLNASDA